MKKRIAILVPKRFTEFEGFCSQLFPDLIVQVVTVKPKGWGDKDGFSHQVFVLEVGQHVAALLKTFCAKENVPTLDVENLESDLAKHSLVIATNEIDPVPQPEPEPEPEEDETTEEAAVT